MTTYRLDYDGDLVAIVEIDHAKADPLIKEMVEFWAHWETRLARNRGSYTQTWLRMLTKRLLGDSVPNGDEGWCALDGLQGIKLTAYCPHEWDEGLIEVTEE